MKPSTCQVDFHICITAPLKNSPRQNSQQLPQKTFIFGIFFIILLTCCWNWVVYYLTKPLWNCVSAKSDLLFRILQPVFVTVCMAQYVANFNLQILYDLICRRSLKIQSRSLKLHFKTGRNSPFKFPFVSLTSWKPKQICIKNRK